MGAGGCRVAGGAAELLDDLLVAGLVGVIGDPYGHAAICRLVDSGDDHLANRGQRKPEVIDADVQRAVRGSDKPGEQVGDLGGLRLDSRRRRLLSDRLGLYVAVDL